MNEKELIIGNSKIAYFEAGENNQEKLLLLHGWLNNKNSFGELISLLESDFHIIAPDFPGFGASLLNRPVSVDNYIELIHKILDVKDIDKANLFGNSMGASIALLFVNKYPDKVKKIVLKSPYYSQRQLPFLVQNRVIRSSLLMPFKSKYTSKIFYKVVFPRFIKLNTPDSSKYRWYNKMVEESANNLPLQAVNILLEILNSNYYESINSSSTPTLVYIAREDEIFSNYREMFVKDNYVVKDCSYHSLFKESSATIAQEVKDFLRS